MSSDIHQQLFVAEQCFRRACSQIITINQSLMELQKRYELATKQHMRAFRYSLRLRISVMEGVRNMFYVYASSKADMITDLRNKVLDEVELSDSELDSDYYDDYATDYSDYDFDSSDFSYSDFDDDDEDIYDIVDEVENVETTHIYVLKQTDYHVTICPAVTNNCEDSEPVNGNTTESSGSKKDTANEKDKTRKL